MAAEDEITHAPFRLTLEGPREGEDRGLPYKAIRRSYEKELNSDYEAPGPEELESAPSEKDLLILAQKELLRARSKPRINLTRSIDDDTGRYAPDDRRAELARAFVQGAIHHAERDGKAWTPLLDLAATPSPQDRSYGERILTRWAGITLMDTEGEQGRGVENPLKVARRLADWVQAQDTPEMLTHLLHEFEAPQVAHVVSEHARVFSADMVRRILLFEGVWPRLLENPHAATDLILGVVAEDGWPALNVEGAQGQRFANKLEETGRKVPEAFFDRVREHLEEAEQDHATWKAQRRQRSGGERAYKIAFCSPDTPADVFERAFAIDRQASPLGRSFANLPVGVETLLENPALPDELRSETTRHVIERRPQRHSILSAVRDPERRLQLDGEVVQKVAEEQGLWDDAAFLQIAATMRSIRDEDLLEAISGVQKSEKAEVLAALATTWRVAQNDAALALVRESRSKEVARALLDNPHLEGEAYRDAMTHAYRIIPQEFLTRMLEDEAGSHGRGDRLLPGWIFVELLQSSEPEVKQKVLMMSDRFATTEEAMKARRPRQKKKAKGRGPQATP